jgi:hypothetical protein
MLATEKAYKMVHGFFMVEGEVMVSTPCGVHFLTLLNILVEGVSEYVNLPVTRKYKISLSRPDFILVTVNK